MKRTVITLTASVAATVAVLTTSAIPAQAATPSGSHTHIGTIAGADFRVEMPQRWNGTLIIYSHVYVPPGTPSPPPTEIALTNRPETSQWLLSHGYALAASGYRSNGYAVEDALSDQVALLDWFTRHVGRPRRTISSGSSMGGGIAVRLAERHPHRFDGVLAQCADLDQQGTWNVALDIAFTIKSLLAADRPIDLVKASNPDASRDELIAAAMAATETAQGRARLALAGAFGNVPGWVSAHEPAPSDSAEISMAQAMWIVGGYLYGMGPSARADLEQRAGGNPSWNAGIDYRQQLARSTQRERVRAAYQEAGLSLDADLATLSRADRIAPDLQALSYMYKHAVATGRLSAPVVTLHGTGDGGAAVEQQRWYASKVPAQQLRQLYVNRGSHCSFNAAEEIAALQTLVGRLDTGRWPSVDPGPLGEEYHLVTDLFSGAVAPMTPGFVSYEPASWIRPSH